MIWAFFVGDRSWRLVVENRGKAVGLASQQNTRLFGARAPQQAARDLCQFLNQAAQVFGHPEPKATALGIRILGDRSPRAFYRRPHRVALDLLQIRLDAHAGRFGDLYRAGSKLHRSHKQVVGVIDT